MNEFSWFDMLILLKTKILSPEHIKLIRMPQDTFTRGQILIDCLQINTKTMAVNLQISIPKFIEICILIQTFDYLASCITSPAGQDLIYRPNVQAAMTAASCVTQLDQIRPAGVAQSVERVALIIIDIPNLKVAGSSPAFGYSYTQVDFLF